MTREEALKILKAGNERKCTVSEYFEAYNMAIQALEQEVDKYKAESGDKDGRIELVIKIPERIHYGIEKGITVNGSQASQILIDAVKNGTPLPKGHGRLLIVSESTVKEHMIGLDAFQQKFIGEVNLSNAIVGVIEADEENKNGNDD